MIFTLAAIFFVFGLIIGSFLNVVIYRLNTAKSLGGRSACMSCQNKLFWYELIPLISFFTLQGRCRTCKTKISLQYPLIELTAGIVFAALFVKFQDLFFLDIYGFFIAYDYYAAMFSILLVIAAYDIKHKIIPDRLVFFLGLFAFAGLFFFPGLSFHIPTALEFFSGVLIAFPFAFIWLVSGGRWMGLGDAKLALGIGWLLGLPIAASGLVLAFWSGAVVGIALVLFSKIKRTGKLGMKSEIPLAPFLVLGAFLAFVCELNFFPVSF